MTADGTTSPLRALVEPRSVAILGASNDATRIGGRTLSYLLQGGYAGRIVPVNPNRTEIQGLPAYPSIADAPAVDTAIVALPAAATLDAVRACAAKGTKACIVFTSGFAETGGEGKEVEREMARIAREAGMRVLGPNCLGAFTPHVGFYGSFSNTLDRAMPEPGTLSIVSQSGAFGTHLSYLARERGLGIRYWISTGNECDVQAAEALDFVARDPGTRTILLYLEGARDGAALVRALETARRAGKPVVAIKVGRSRIGALAAASHTASLAGGDAVYRAVFRDHGAWSAGSAEEAVDVAYACERGRYPAGRRLGIVTISGGGGILIADQASDHALEMPELPEAAQATLKESLPFCAPRNPVDITAQAFNRMDLFARNLEVIVEQGGYDAVVAFFTTVPGSPAIAPALKAALRDLRAGHPSLPIVLTMLVEPDLEREYEALGFPVFRDANRAVRAIAALCHFAESFAAPSRDVEDAPPAGIGDLPAEATEHEALAILRGAGLPVIEGRVCRTVEEAVEAGRRIGWPVVMKISSPDVPHKTEIGGVVLGVADEAGVRDAYGLLTRRLATRAPSARFDGVLVSRQVEGAVETIVGIENDPVFGPVVMFGLGGILTEILRDVTFALAPLDRDAALAMIRRVRGHALLTGARGRPPCDVDALADALVALSRWAARHRRDLVSLDVNPLAVLPDGSGCLAIDASLHTRAR